MKNILHVDGQLYIFLSRFWDMVKLNFLWLVFSIPIVTIGPSTVAAYKVTLDMVEDNEGHVAESFIKAFKGNLKQGIPLGLMALAVMYIAYLNFELFNKIQGNPTYFLIGGLIVAFMGLTHFTYAFPLCAKYENTMIQMLLNSGEISKRYFVRSVILWLVILVLLILFMFNSTLMFFGILIGPVSVFLTVSGFARKFFDEIEQEG